MGEEYPDADQAAVDEQPPPSQRIPLSRDRIVSAALEFIDDKGLPGLTMRRLGEQLGVEAMALYRYVPSKEDLLDAVVEALVADVRADEVVLDAPQDGCNIRSGDPKTGDERPHPGRHPMLQLRTSDRARTRPVPRSP